MGLAGPAPFYQLKYEDINNKQAYTNPAFNK
ncbi:hypothetical protein ABIE26_004810 [Pedobacter africanus]|uniref:Uncharacterized protein n=1 Tax=Pedobacter africanus TaxID=151894 RepID=A0ACC6L2L1_9SPHI|nr:hypothetical protein [Pedobacter africanus]